MNVFNSLGSNYDLKFALNALFTRGNKNYSKELRELLESKYGGKVILFYKGREALKSALEILDMPKDSYVAINGFTCWAVYEAIVDAGLKVEYFDLEDKDLNFSAKTLENKIKRNSRIKVVIVQNTLGYTCNISQIKKICKINSAILIEDLAHSVGSLYNQKKETGSVGDFVIFSFSQDKMIDGISGGALVIRNRKFQERLSLDLDTLSLKSQFKDKLYPLLSWLIRSTYVSGLGKILHFIFKQLDLLTKPIEDKSSINPKLLSDWYCSLIKLGFVKLNKDIKHRKDIASIYAKRINEKVLSEAIMEKIPISSNLRFPIFVKNREKLIEHLKKDNIFVSDIWYDAPIAPKKFLHLTDYKGQCPNSEVISKQIVNLPTHTNISEQDAIIISQKINQWVESQ